MLSVHLVKVLNFFWKSYTRKASLVASLAFLFYLLRRYLSRNIPRVQFESRGPSLNSNFLRQLGSLLPIAIPSYKSQEAVMSYSLLLLVLVRSVLSILVSTLNGKLLKALVTVNSKQFFRRVGSM